MYEIQIYERLWNINAMINGVYKLLYLFQTKEKIEMYNMCCRMYFSLYTYNLLKLFSVVHKKTVYD